MDDLRKKLLFRSEHRGTKEMDLIMGTFAHDFLPQASDAEVKAYEELLHENDPDLYNWISEREPVPARLHDNHVLQKLVGYQVTKRA